MRAQGIFKKGLVTVYIETIRIFSALICFEIGYFGGEEHPEIGILNPIYISGTKTFQLTVLQIHKFSINIILKFGYEY